MPASSGHAGSCWAELFLRCGWHCSVSGFGGDDQVLIGLLMLDVHVVC